MSFTKMKQPELFTLATEGFGCDLEETATKDQILAKMAEDGITWDMAVTFNPELEAYEEKKPKTEPAAKKGRPVKNKEDVVATQNVPDDVLVKMNRENPVFEVRGYRFLQTHPFVLVDAENADYIVSNVEGFSYATPKEAAEFYG